MTIENPRWGHMRVLGELRKLGFGARLQKDVEAEAFFETTTRSSTENR